MPHPLLGLVMIVRDEAHGIIDTIDTFLPFVDHVTLVDTGSIDGTQEILRGRLDRWAAESKPFVAWYLIEAPFVDFSTARNHALDEHGEATTFTIMPDADYRLSGGAALREFLETHRDPASLLGEISGGYDVHLCWGGDVGDFYLPLVLRTAARWRYAGKVHEAVVVDKYPIVQISGVKIAKIVPAKSRAASADRWARDRALLEADLAAKPGDPRTIFYLAQTLECLGEHAAAEQMYADRVRAGGWNAETYEALFRRAKILSRIAPWWIAMHAYLEAHAFSPDRAEPLYAVADHYHELKQWPLAYLFAARAAALPMPTSTLFVDRPVYQWQAAEMAASSASKIGDPDPRASEPIDHDKLPVIAELRSLRAEILRLTTRQRELLADVDALRAAAFLAAEEGTDPTRL
jgi:tetratricopeptide (TPR) repeat protein